MHAVLAGFLTGLSLIIAIGAQNAMVLRQGLAREHVGVVVAVCTVSDLALIIAGTAGIGALIQHAGWLLTVVRWLGVAFLTWYGVSSILRARHAAGLTAADADRPSRRSVLARITALTWLNPHVYLDTVLLLGSIAATHGSVGRWWFAVGAGVASIIWFVTLGYGARLAAPLLSKPRSWQVLDVLIGLTMIAIAISLALG